VVRRNPKADWIIIPNTHEPLISRETFDAAIAKRRVRHNDSSQSRTRCAPDTCFSREADLRHLRVPLPGRDQEEARLGEGGLRLRRVQARGKHTCEEHFLPADIIEPAVFKALEDEVMTLDVSARWARPGR